MRIYKYPLQIADEQVIEMPVNPMYLHVAGPPMGQDQNQILLWALVDPKLPTETHRFLVYGTGHEIGAPPWPYIGTARTHGNSMVWHVFDGGTVKE